MRRRSEIRIRLALGATHGHITRLVLKQGALLVFAGVVIGLVALGQAVASLIFGISPSNPLQLGAAAIALSAAAAIGAAIPARLASRLDPMKALYEE